MYSDRTVVQFPNLDLLQCTKRHGQLWVFRVLGAAVAKWLNSWIAEQEVRFRLPASPLEFQRLVISIFQVAIWPKYRWSHVNPQTNQPTNFSVPNLTRNGHRDVRRRLVPPCHRRAHTRQGYAGNRARISRSTVQPATSTPPRWATYLKTDMYPDWSQSFRCKNKHWKQL